MRHICIFIFNFIIGATLFAQQQKDTIAQPKDSVSVIKKKYGIRVGADISQPIIALFEKGTEHKSVELIGDFRIKEKYYIAVELGYESKRTEEDFFSYSTKGSFLKMGANRNFYENWGEMNNEIFVGVRYATAFFNHTVHQYTPNVSNKYFPVEQKNTAMNFDGLSAHWAEFILGLKVETFKNLFVGMNAQFKVLIYSKQPDNFRNIYIPGFRAVSDNNLGFGFTYTISYLIPLLKK
ncbi:MAG: hypothetical protein KGV44_04440 [Flavobacteriaceae bacterium]|nr:hypothetical protein [Flavobacteriaceae bacterium]